jgi:uncharacterized membrane protein
MFPGYHFSVAYPLIPWVGVMAAGYGLGSLWLEEAPRRRRWLLSLGMALILLFVTIRWINGYGDPHAWESQKNPVFRVLAFIHCQKYPPSLDYLLMTLGPALALLSWLDRGFPSFLKPIVVFGRVPLFYYLLHLPLIHGLAVLAAFVEYGSASWLYGSAATPRPENYGYGLPVVYLVWLAVVLALYPVCLWFSRLKQRRREVWLSYL